MSLAFTTPHTVCGLEEIAGHGGRGISHVLSILDPGTPEPDFGGYGRHRRVTLRFHDAIAPAPGIVLPRREDIAAILAFGREIVAGNSGEMRYETHLLVPHLLVHCHLGLSRSTAALAALLAQRHPETPAAELIAHLHALRDGAWPNTLMIAFADEALGRRGSLIEAVRRLHARQLARNPKLDGMLREIGRGAEVDAARDADTIPRCDVPDSPRLG